MCRVIALIVVAAMACLAQADRGNVKLTPTPDATAPLKIYIPKDLDDCFVELEKMLPTTLINEMKKSSERDMISYHDNLGRWLRNNWALWAGSRLSAYFNRLGIQHPDDMSGIIFTSFWRHLHSQPVRLEEQIESTKEYYRKAAEKETSITLVSNSAMNWPLRSYSGGTLRLADYKGKVLVLGWWYLLCKPSQLDCDMIPDLVKLKNIYGSQGLEVVGMPGIYPFNSTREATRVKKLIAKYHINFKLVWVDYEFTNDVEEYERFGYSSSPQVFVISRDGYVVKRIRGFDAPALRVAVEKALRDVPKTKTMLRPKPNKSLQVSAG
jgi:hypothetical protein